jgi:hypothetical protein
VSDEDSGSEDECPNVNNLSRRQLMVPVEGHLLTRSHEINELPSVSSAPVETVCESDSVSWIKRDLIPKQRGLFPTDNSMEFLNNPLKCFEAVMTDAIIEWMVIMFQLYVAQRYHDFAFQTNGSEIRAFLGILYLSSYISVPRWRMMWEDATETSNLFVYEAMSRARFEIICTLQ